MQIQVLTEKSYKPIPEFLILIIPSGEMLQQQQKTSLARPLLPTPNSPSISKQKGKSFI